MPRRDAWMVAGLTVASALLFGLAFPPTGWLPLAWCALAPFFVALRSSGTARATLLTWLWCLVAAWGVGVGFVTSLAYYFEQPLPVAIALFFAVVTVMAGPCYLAAALSYRVLARRFGVALPFLAAAAWVLAELGRGRLFFENPWGLLGYTHADSLVLIQIASLTGIYGVSFAVACVNASLAELWISWREPARRPQAAIAFLLAPLPAAFCLAYGTLVLQGSGSEAPQGAVSVAVAQGNVDIGSRWRSDAYGENLDVYLKLTHAALKRADPRIVFWPEAALTFFLEDETLYRLAIAVLLRQGDLQLVAGGPRAFGSERDLFTNSVFVVEPDGSLPFRYDQEYLLRFAEYLPLRKDAPARTFGRIRSIEHAEQVDPLPTRAGLAGVLIGNEVVLPEAARRRVRAGAAYLVNPSNDTWISDEGYTEQQLDIALVRAVEQRRWLLRASSSGPSAMVDPFGRVLRRTPGLRRALLVGQIAPRTDLTWYARVGDAFAFGCAAVVLVGVFLVRRREAHTGT